MAKRLMIGGVDCSQMEVLAAKVLQYGPESLAGQKALELLEPMDRANRRYLRKRNTRRLGQLFVSSLWNSPHRARLIFEVIQRRAAHAVSRVHAASGIEPIKEMLGQRQQQPAVKTLEI